MGYVQFFYFLGHLSVKIFLLFSIANALVCGNVLVLRLTFWLLRKTKKETVEVKPEMARAKFVDAGTGKEERWVLKEVWVKEE